MAHRLLEQKSSPKRSMPRRTSIPEVTGSASFPLTHTRLMGRPRRSVYAKVRPKQHLVLLLLRSLSGPCTAVGAGSGSRSVGCEPFVQYPPRYDPYSATPRSGYNFTPTGLVSPTSAHPLGPPSRFPPPVRLAKKRTHSQSPLADLMDVHALTRHSQGSLNMHPSSLTRCRSTGSSGSYGHLSAGSLGAMSPGTPGGGRRPASLGGSPYYPPPFLPMHPHGPQPPLFAPRLEPCVPTSAATGATKRSSSSKSMEEGKNTDVDGTRAAR